MPNIVPVSDLRNYPEVLRNVTKEQPVYLTKNGRGSYVLMDIEEYEKTQATLYLLNDLTKGKKSGEENQFFSGFFDFIPFVLSLFYFLYF